MRWVSYISEDGTTRCGVLIDQKIHGFKDADDLLGVIKQEGLTLTAAGHQAIEDPLEVVPYADAEILPPIASPPAVRDFMSFEQHVITSQEAIGSRIDPGWYDAPVFYFQNPAAIRGANEDIRISPGSLQFDYEVEMAAVIGRPGSDLTPSEGEAAIAGFILFCDWSARDLQMVEMKQGLGPVKGKDSATSLGPFLVTPDELTDRRSGKGFNISVSATVNNRLYSVNTMADLYWSYGEMVAYASRGTVLRAGDIIGSGTVGTGCILELSRVHGEDAYPWLRPGDAVKIEAEVLGSIQSTIMQAPAVVPLLSS